jgi:hypothetical protein
MTVENGRILDEIRGEPCMGRVKVTIPRDSRSNIPEREAVLQVRYASYPVKRPYILNKVKTLPDAVTLQVVYVREEKPPAGKKPVEWFLVTSEPVNNSDEAYKYVKYYVQRWKIERFHYVLKSGCAIEKLQERSIDKSGALIFMYSIIAVKILNMTYAARLKPELPCSLLFGEEEWKLLYCIANKTKKEPKKPYTIKEAADYLGWLGGPKRAPRSLWDLENFRAFFRKK